jgi:hypothetical protein
LFENIFAGSSLSSEANSKAVLPKQCFFVTKAPLVEDNDKDPYPVGAELEERTYLGSRAFMVPFDLKDFLSFSCTLYAGQSVQLIFKLTLNF